MIIRVSDVRNKNRAEWLRGGFARFFVCGGLGMSGGISNFV